MLPELVLTVNINISKSIIHFAYEFNTDSNDLVNGLRSRLANNLARRANSRANPVGVDCFCLLFAVACHGFRGVMVGGYRVAIFSIYDTRCWLHFIWHVVQLDDRDSI